MRIRRILPLLFAALIAASVGSAADDKKEPPKKPGVFTDPSEAGPDFQTQGEYAGDLKGKGKLGAQVVALGDGKFDVYFLAGGLPGAGWDKKGRTKAPAKNEGGKTTFSGSGWSGTIVGATLTGKSPDGDEFALKKVERKSPTLGAKPPEGATVLYGGPDDVNKWNGGKVFEKDLLFCGTTSKKGFGAGKLHVEFRTPFQPKARGQGRGNSGVYVQGVEVQVLDSFGLTGANNECGAFYGKSAPAVNMCFPPLSWQTFDIEIKDEGGKTVATVLHNGVKVHDNLVIKNGPPKPATINLQNHGNPVVYRNIWAVEAK